MKSLIVGIALGALVTAAAYLLLAEDDPSSVVGSTTAPTQSRDSAPTTLVSRPAPELQPAPAPSPQADPFEPGTAVLGIGDAYDFGDATVRATRDGADIVCLDIRYEASLACNYGAVPADRPLHAEGLPRKPSEVAALVTDAPEHLPRRMATLPLQFSQRHPGVELIQARHGKVYKVYMAERMGDPDALRRRVRIRYEEVPRVAGGGIVQSVLKTSPDGEPTKTLADIQRIMAIGRSIPGGSNSKYLSGEYRRATDLADDVVLDKRAYLLLEESLASNVTLDRGGLYAARGIDRGGVVTLDRAGLAVEGDIDGHVKTKRAYVYASGDLTGSLDASGYSTLVIEGDLRGTLRVRSYIDLLLRGRVLGTLDVKGSCWSTFYFESYTTKAQLESLPGNFRQITLHLRESDLAPGEHKVGTWRTVVVGASVWEKIAR